MSESSIIIYPAADGKTSIQLRVQDGSVLLTQLEIAELSLTTKQNVGQHIKKILEEKELPRDSVVKESFTTAADGRRWLSGPCRPERPPDSSNALGIRFSRISQP